jgi:hypothetical protein
VSATGLLASAGHVVRVQRRQRAIASAGRARDASRVAPRVAGLLLGPARVYLCATVVYFAWRKAHAVDERSSFWLGLLAAAFAWLASGSFFQFSSLSFTAREVLRHPDKASVLLARLLRALPAQLLVGATLAVAVFLPLHGEWQAQPLAIAALCAIAVFAPLARTVGNLLQRLVAPDAGSVVMPACLVALCTAYLAGPAQWTNDGLWLSCAVLLLGLLPLAGLAHGLTRAARASMRAAWIDLLRAPRAFALFVLVAPTTLWRQSPWLPLAALVGIACLVLLLPVALRAVLRAVNTAEAETRGNVVTRGTEHDRAADRAPRTTAVAPHTGRSLWRATWCAHWMQQGITWRDALHPLVLVQFLVQHASGIACATTLVAAGRLAPAGLLVLWAATFPTWSDRLRHRLYRLGVDLHEQARHHVLLVLCTGAAPTLLAAALAATLASKWNEPTVLVLAALAAAFLLRVGWRGLLRRPESASLGAGSLLVLLVAAAAHLAAWAWPVARPGIAADVVQRLVAEGRGNLVLEATVLQWPIVAAVAAVGLFGLLRRIALWREPALLDDWIATREHRVCEPVAAVAPTTAGGEARA